jgi:hypothetical protein
VLDGHLQSLNEEIDQKVAKLPRKARSEYDGVEIEMLASGESIRIQDINIEHHRVAKIIEEETEMNNHREHIKRS